MCSCSVESSWRAGSSIKLVLHSPETLVGLYLLGVWEVRMADLKVTLTGAGRYEGPATLLKFRLQLGNSGWFFSRVSDKGTTCLACLKHWHFFLSCLSWSHSEIYSEVTKSFRHKRKIFILPFLSTDNHYIIWSSMLQICDCVKSLNLRSSAHLEQSVVTKSLKKSWFSDVNTSKPKHYADVLSRVKPLLIRTSLKQKGLWDAPGQQW